MTTNSNTVVSSLTNDGEESREGFHRSAGHGDHGDALGQWWCSSPVTAKGSTVDTRSP